jgi:hypothetical protein
LAGSRSLRLNFGDLPVRLENPAIFQWLTSAGIKRATIVLGLPQKPGAHIDYQPRRNGSMHVAAAIIHHSIAEMNWQSTKLITFMMNMGEKSEEVNEPRMVAIRSMDWELLIC